MTRLLLIGRFGQSEAGRPPRKIDLDSFDATLEALAPALAVGDETITFSRLEDFHPDELYRKLVRFADLREVRRRLLDPLTFAATAAALDGTAPSEDDARTVERILGVRPAAKSGKESGDFIERIVAPYVVPDIGPRQKRLVGAIDQAASQHLNTLLHHPPLQRLEAAWRAVHRLVTTVEADDLAIYLLDASVQELRTEELRFADGAPDGRPWSMLALDETFGAGEHDVAVLGALGALAAGAGAPLVAAAHPRLAGFSSFAPLEPAALPPDDAARWTALRESTNARWLGLAAPRWLVRLPYGARTDPLDSFPFEEVIATPESYLWGSPAFACAILLAAGSDELDDLPCHTFRRDGEAHLQPVAEALLPDRAAAAMLEGGLIPLLSVRDRGAATVARMQSLAGLPLGR